MSTDTTLHQHKDEVTDAAERTHTRKVFVPLVDIYETADAIVLVADMPGVDETGVDVSMEKNLLTIRGAVSGKAPEGCSLTYSEFGEGDFERVFTLSNEVDRDGVEATVKNGVLRLTLPKSRHARAKKVAVMAG